MVLYFYFLHRGTNKSDFWWRWYN